MDLLCGLISETQKEKRTRDPSSRIEKGRESGCSRVDKWRSSNWDGKRAERTERQPSMEKKGYFFWV
jgi:hypothetical protein